MVVNPSDGNVSFKFDSPLWTNGGVGVLDGKDYMSETVSETLPLHGLEIKSINHRTNQIGVKKYKILPEYKEKTFRWMMKNLFNTTITDDPYYEEVPGYGYDDDPIMYYSGGLKVNAVWADDGVRLSSIGQSGDLTNHALM